MTGSMKDRDEWDEEALRVSQTVYVSAGEQAELELRSHFVGKRDGVRQPCDLDVMLRGRGGSFTGQTVDISRSGVLLRITDQLYNISNDDLASFAGRIEKHFRTRVDVFFVEAGLRKAAEVARLTMSEMGEFLMACQFREQLSRKECELLEIDGGDDREEEAAE
jgi:hypothetical protein